MGRAMVELKATGCYPVETWWCWTCQGTLQPLTFAQAPWDHTLNVFQEEH